MTVAIVHNDSKGTFAIRQNAFKLTVQSPRTIEQLLNDAASTSFLLYNLNDDVEETTNIAPHHPELVKQMYTLLRNSVREK